jgi:hypothetical protein
MTQRLTSEDFIHRNLRSLSPTLKIRVRHLDSKELSLLAKKLSSLKYRAKLEKHEINETQVNILIDRIISNKPLSADNL